jgi:hypothetical protein
MPEAESEPGKHDSGSYALSTAQAGTLACLRLIKVRVPMFAIIF